MNNKISSLKCPKCGFDFLLPSNINKKIFDMMATKGKRLRRLYKLLSKTIKKELPSENDRTEFYYFLKAIDDTNERIIIWGINKYLEDNLIHKGYGLAYLRGIIRNKAQNSDILRIKEKKRLGTSPPIKEIT
tara:strand:- start:1532 stop:1927 length:396 start_codon:yes stop_codon:yes gene_type:complete